MGFWHVQKAGSAATASSDGLGASSKAALLLQIRSASMHRQPDQPCARCIYHILLETFSSVHATLASGASLMSAACQPPARVLFAALLSCCSISTSHNLVYKSYSGVDCASKLAHWLRNNLNFACTPVRLLVFLPT